ncbi:hypothetical protein GCM10019016_009890 [Streptomyces prasinosporus]|uniref:Uncharacterized protein n=1 Tax=Streptomyces prasinosporus TaxID=68256 RepID=A0ABP6TGC6_9ACTN|nr:hypothetical protein GCM10010332_69780 [Streptomyces albogriseolus]
MCTQNTSESSGSDFGLPLSSDEFRSLWDRREKPFERQCPYMPSLPLLLNGKLVEDLERMNAENAGNLYVTPVAYGGDLALAAFTDRKDMLSEAQKVIDSAELHWLMEERAIGCLPEGAPAPQVLDCHDVLDLRGERLRTPPNRSWKDLSLVPRREFLNWDNCIRSVDVCAYPYSAYSEKEFHGVEHFINFRCGFNPTVFGINTSSLVNWGTNPPDF